MLASAFLLHGTVPTEPLTMTYTSIDISSFGLSVTEGDVLAIALRTDAGGRYLWKNSFPAYDRGEPFTREPNVMRRAEHSLIERGRVLVDANFGEERHRAAFLQAATRLAIPAVLLLCQADTEIVQHRLSARRRDASDADWSIYRQGAERWEEPGPGTLKDAIKAQAVTIATCRVQCIRGPP